MNVAIITPIPHLDDYAVHSPGESYHLVLSHVVLSNRPYAEFYGSLPRPRFIILDNSAHEMLEGQTDIQLANAWAEIGADEIVLPDRLFFGDDTVEMSSSALSVLRHRTTAQFMAVPQGRTFDEWENCLTRLLELDVETIGISKDYEVWPGGIRGLVERVADARNRVDKKVRVHLLGWGRDALSIRGISDPSFCDGIIRGIDSAKPLVYASAGVTLPSVDEIDRWSTLTYPRRPSKFFSSRLPEGSKARCLHNISAFKGLLACV